jgi:hypothetical protein
MTCLFTRWLFHLCISKVGLGTFVAALHLIVLHAPFVGPPLVTRWATILNARLTIRFKTFPDPGGSVRPFRPYLILRPSMLCLLCLPRVAVRRQPFKRSRRDYDSRSVYYFHKSVPLTHNIIQLQTNSLTFEC